MSKKKCLKVPSRGFSLYSSGSEDPVVMTHKGLDRCASLLAHIMESPSNDGDRRFEGRDKQREATGLKTKPKKRVKKKSCKKDKSRMKAQPKVDKNAQTITAERKTQPGRKKSKLAHHQVVFQPGLASSTPQREVNKDEDPKQVLETASTLHAQAIQENNQVRGQVYNSPSKFVGQFSRVGSAGHYGDQMIPERDTSKGSRHLGQDPRGQNKSSGNENSQRVTDQDKVEFVKQRYRPISSGRQSSVGQGGYHGYTDDCVPADVESVTSNEIASLLNNPK